MVALDNICIDKNTKGGKSVIKGTRVLVYLVLGKLTGGMTYERIIREYEITREDVLASFRYDSNYIAVIEIRAVVWYMSVIDNHEALKFLVDEDLPRSTAPKPREIGFEAFDVRDCGLRGKSDEEVLLMPSK